MLGFDDYKLLKHGTTLGEVRKKDSDMIMEATWDGDIATRTIYLFDYYHDPEPKKYKDLDMRLYRNLPSTRAKYIIATYQSIEKDVVPFKIQFKPSYICNVPYYKEFFADRYDAIFPVGLYCLVPDEKGRYFKWIVVSTADSNAPQFPTYAILPCDYLLTWVNDNKKRYMLGALRSMNSYNAGDWLGHMFRIPEDVQQIFLPMNRLSETLYYNQRIIIDNKVLTEPRTWRISKINRLDSYGILHATFAQDAFNKDVDFIEKDENGNVIAFWADMFNTTGGVVAQDDSPAPLIHGEVTFSGTKPQIKLGGGYKKFTVDFYDGEEHISPVVGNWEFLVDNVDISSEIEILTAADSDDVLENQIKVKIPNPNWVHDDLLGKKLTTVYKSTIGVDAKLEIDIVGL